MAIMQSLNLPNLMPENAPLSAPPSIITRPILATRQCRGMLTLLRRNVCRNPRQPSAASYKPRQSNLSCAFPPADKNTGHNAINSSSGRSSVAINGWQYCLAPSHAEHKVYISPPFPKSADLRDTETSFGQILLQSKVQHDDVQCPIGSDESSISSMRKYAISFNRKFGNTIVTLSWEPSQFYPPEDEDPVDENIYTGNSDPSAEATAWQYCLAPSYAENKVYISSPFPKSTSLYSTETAFAKMLSHTQHDAIQCPNGKDEPSVSSLREHAISFNHELGRTIITLNWDPKTDPAASVAIKREDSSR